MKDEIAADIAKSVETQGLLQAIGVRRIDAETDTYEVVFGAHRLAAYKLLRRTHIDAYVLPEDLLPEEYLLIELQENSVRNDLSGTQRKAYAGEIGRIIAKLAEHRHGAIGNEEWFKEMAKTSNLADRTLRNWWSAFCQEAALSLTPRQALDIHKQQFYAWLEQQRENEAAEQARRREEIRQEKQVDDFLEGQETLQYLVKEYGEEAVFYGVVCVVFPNLAPHGLHPA